MLRHAGLKTIAAEGVVVVRLQNSELGASGVQLFRCAHSISMGPAKRRDPETPA